jgi:hypothetical protein
MDWATHFNGRVKINRGRRNSAVKQPIGIGRERNFDRISVMINFRIIPLVFALSGPCRV